MTRDELEHVLRAAAAVAGEDDLVVVGSSAILAMDPHGVGPETAKAPEGWEDRLILVEGPGTRGARGWCLEAHDLVLSKLVAGREKDLAFAREAVTAGLVDVTELAGRVDALPVPAGHRDAVRAHVLALSSSG